MKSHSLLEPFLAKQITAEKYFSWKLIHHPLPSYVWLKKSFHQLCTQIQIDGYDFENFSEASWDVSSINSEEIFDSVEREKEEFYSELEAIIKVNEESIYVQDEWDMKTQKIVSKLYIDYENLEIR